nr:uncharacterized protein LOC128677433 [Plodia interpunctella]
MPKGKKKNYDTNNLNLALQELEESNKPKIREIARKYGVPKSTLHYKLKNPDHKTSFGPRPVLTENEESILELWIKRLMRKGFPLKIEDLQRSVHKFLIENPRPNPFKDNYPGDGWVKAFLKRHPDIVPRTSEGVTQSSACVSEKDIRKWFEEIRQYLTEVGLFDILNEASRIFNGDESGFQLCPKTGKVLAIKGTKNVYNIDSNNSKECITVMFTFSASGETCPPMVVYKYQRIPQKVAEGIPTGWGVGRSDNGWMTSELFFEYIANVFYPYLQRRGIKLPVIYFLDGHKTHLTYEVSKLCKELGIELIALYPNATRILQPADVSVFRPVKAAWKDAARTWLINNPGETITKINFAGILEDALNKSIKAETLINGFRACGLMPFNPDAIDYTKCLGSDKNKQVEINNCEIQQNNLTFLQFSQIVGPTKLAELANSTFNCDITGENFQLLCRIYEAFINPQCNVENNPNVLSTSSYIEPNTGAIRSTENGSIVSNDNSHEESQSKVPIIPQVESYSIDFSHTYSENILPPQIETGFDSKSIETNTPCNNTSNIGTLDSYPVVFDNNDTEGATETVIEDHSKMPVYVTPSKHSSITLPLSEAIIVRNASCPKDKSPAFKIISNSNFAPFLTMPKTPERKGKRNTVRFPFAITSEKYRAMFKEQKEKKESLLKIKDQRKCERQEKKQKKEMKKKENLNNQVKPKTSNTNACKICLKVTKITNRLSCDMCSCIFHVKCIPDKHKQHVPEDILIDLFICHNCYKEEDEDDDTIRIEENVDLEENNSSSEDEEALSIFKIYQDQNNNKF